MKEPQEKVILTGLLDQLFLNWELLRHWKTASVVVKSAVTLKDYFVLEIVSRKPGIVTSDIMRILGWQQGSMDHCLRKLCRQGFVTVDRSVKFGHRSVWLMPLGKKALPGIRISQTAQLNSVLLEGSMGVGKRIRESDIPLVAIAAKHLVALQEETLKGVIGV